ASFVIVSLWLKSFSLALAVGVSTLAAVGSAPLVALLVTELLELEHKDPAIGAGPIATVVQDTISVVVYGVIASALLLG
ncbi:magnesium transporter, partial [Candidatus Collierbacteria bacterium]|nr:magnesium transporter [Candidatus Collierbacteria bacterium]